MRSSEVRAVFGKENKSQKGNKTTLDEYIHEKEREAYRVFDRVSELPGGPLARKQK